MRVRLLPLACTAALLAACQPFGWEGFHLDRARRDTEKPYVPQPRDSSTTGGGGTEAVRTETAVYVSAVVFPRGYDWERDTSWQSVDKTLVLLRNGVGVLSLPAGPGTEIGTDPDMHRILDGRLYSDYSTPTETVVRRDGVELFRFEGREHFLSFQLWDGHIHTLGRNRNGSGFAYRVDGKAVFRQDRGSPIGSLQRDGNTVCFAYEQGTARYLYADGRTTALSLPEKISGVYDARRRNGEWQLALRSEQGGGSPVLLLGETRYAPSFPWNAQQVNRCRFADAGDKILLTISYQTAGGVRQDAVWNRYASEMLFPAGQKVHAFFFSEEGIGCLATTDEGIRIRPPGGQESSLPGHFRFFTENCAFQDGKRVWAVLTGMGGTASVLWRDGEAETLPLWGYLTGVSVREEEVPSSQ